MFANTRYRPSSFSDCTAASNLAPYGPDERTRVTDGLNRRDSTAGLAEIPSTSRNIFCATADGDAGEVGVLSRMRRCSTLARSVEASPIEDDQINRNKVRELILLTAMCSQFSKSIRSSDAGISSHYWTAGRKGANERRRKSGKLLFPAVIYLQGG
jgi:hypothetical protein